MKNSFLILSLLLTSLVFTMSFVSGADSGELSSGVTALVYKLTSNIFPNSNLDLDVLHAFIRKAAHVTEYAILAITWFITIKAYNLSFSWFLFIGITIASTDEAIQILAVDRGPSIFDVIVYDFIPFAIIGLVILFITNRKGEKVMATDTLARLQSNHISPELAYKELFKKEKRVWVPFFKRAHFLKLRIHFPGEKGANSFLAVLFFIPCPLLLLRILLGFVKIDKYSNDIPLSKREIINLISYKGVIVKVNTHSGEKILIKTI